MADCEGCGRKGWGRKSVSTSLLWLCADCRQLRPVTRVERRYPLETVMPLAGLAFLLAVILAVLVVFGG